MKPFKYIKNKLHVENVPVSEIAEIVGTPVYIYSASHILERYETFRKAFEHNSGAESLICYALKSNSNIKVAGLLARQGAGCDIVSGWELERALLAGFDPSKIVFSGVGKSQSEIKTALKHRALMLNVESEEELEMVQKTAKDMHLRAPIAIRLNPDIDPDTHHHITTGKAENKFGIHLPDIIRIYTRARAMPELNVIGIHCHLGSQIMNTRPYVQAAHIILELIGKLKDIGLKLKYLDIGGGMGITYNHEQPFAPGTLAKQILPLLKGSGLTLIIEPGRCFVGEAGVLATKVLYQKRSSHKPYRHFIIVDAGMNDLIRPALYEAYHNILPARLNKRWDNQLTVEVVGPVCESGDYLAKNRHMPPVKNGDILCVMTAGAYGMTMSSNYNSRPRPAEVMVKDGKWQVIRRRETLKDILRCEIDLKKR